MAKNLVIVESPTKAKTIEGFLGKDYVVKSSFGHVRDLSKKNLSVDINKDFHPFYEVTSDKIKVIKDLKKLADESDIVWLASDEDREGEAISWHLVETLKLNEKKARRIVFHEITKSAIIEAINNPRGIDMNLVDAQQARRVLDRLVGFELSPILWKKIKPALSAGRVQSVAVRLIVEREEEIKNFKPVSSYRVTASFTIQTKNGNMELRAELLDKFASKEEAITFLEKCKTANFTITDIETKPVAKSPAPPFTTSTLTQEASRKLGFSVANTMRIAQQLYESGKITYMRTDSVNLSNLALSMAKDVITNTFGADYLRLRKYTTRTKGAQEAHEAIRPTYLEKQTISGDLSQKKLYDLIWKRTIASQMSDALREKTNVLINISTTKEKFVARGEVIKFDGFLKVYLESTDDENGESEEGMLPPVEVGQSMMFNEIYTVQKFTQPPPRYSEASLVKKLEELGIGRPSTYAPTLSTIQKREYIEKSDIPSISREYDHLTLKDTQIRATIKSEKTGSSKGKLVPTDIGILVNNYLLQNFINIMDYNFTANVEKEFDEIAHGQKVWNDMIRDFYGPFHKQVETAMSSTEKAKGEKLLGVDSDSGKNVYVKLGKFGPIVQLGETDNTIKPKFAALKKEQSIENITLQEALDMFKLPRILGHIEGEELIVALGKFGPYIRHKSSFYSLSKYDDPLTITSERAFELIEEKRKKEKEKILKEFEEDKKIKVMKGRWGPYIAMEKDNYKIPKGKDPLKLSLADCHNIIHVSKPSKSKRKRKKS
ncbi:MAG: type I DNA topoisomerase [Bacteroidetes bacterium]|nr:type I DNA topoisomerase [Bacteroidota bacterium]